MRFSLLICCEWLTTALMHKQITSVTPVSCQVFALSSRIRGYLHYWSLNYKTCNSRRRDVLTETTDPMKCCCCCCCCCCFYIYIRRTIKLKSSQKAWFLQAFFTFNSCLMKRKSRILVQLRTFFVFMVISHSFTTLTRDDILFTLQETINIVFVSGITLMYSMRCRELNIPTSGRSAFRITWHCLWNQALAVFIQNCSFSIE